MPERAGFRSFAASALFEVYGLGAAKSAEAPIKINWDLMIPIPANQIYQPPNVPTQFNPPSETTDHVLTSRGIPSHATLHIAAVSSQICKCISKPTYEGGRKKKKKKKGSFRAADGSLWPFHTSFHSKLQNMHQNNPRPAVYRSFRRTLLVGCEDSKESIGCRTSGKSKTSSSAAMEPTVYYTRRARQDMKPTCMGCMEEQINAVACRGSSDLQLLQISREAQKLNQMIDSLSKGPSFGGRSKDIANDLLRGALDLQESLVMLGKLQEASRFMSQTKRKQKNNLVEEKEEEMDAELMGSGRFEIRAPLRNFVGDDGDCVEELKKVIKKGLYRQNHLPISSVNEKASSSRSLKFPTSGGFGDPCCEQKKTKKESSVSSAAAQRKAEAPNLIAKLMGLEEAFSETVRPVSKEPARKKSSNQTRPFFDIEMPKATKLPSTEERPDPERKTLQEIIEAMQFKGLLKGGGDEDPRVRSGFSNTSRVERFDRCSRVDDEVPPIVIIKPMQSPCLEREKVQKGLLNSNISVQEKMQTSKLIEEDAVSELMLPKKVEMDKEKKTVEEAKVELSGKTKASASSLHKQQKKEVIKMRKKPDEMHKPVMDRRKSVENKNMRSVRVSKSQIITTPSMPNKPEKIPVPVKKNVSTQTSDSHHMQHRPTKPVSRNATGTAKEKRILRTKPVEESPIVKTIVDNSLCKGDNKETSPAQETSICTMLSTLPSDDLPEEAEHDFRTHEKDNVKDPSSVCEVKPQPNHSGGSSGLAEAATQLPNNKTAAGTAAGSEDHLNSLLLGSPSFLICAQELFVLDHHQPTDCQRTGIKEIGTYNSNLLLDCASELMTCKSYLWELTNHPMSQNCAKGSITRISMDQLVEEVSNGIEKLRSYSKIGDGVTSEDSLSTRLERDLKCSGTFTNGGWDWGWMNAVPVEEANRVVYDVEEHILYGLIEEVTRDLVY